MIDKKILLVYPDYRTSEVFQGVNLPVGLGYIAESLYQNNIEYRYIDLNLESKATLFQTIKDFAPDFVGISMMSFLCDRTYKILEKIKNDFNEVTIIAGGPHITANKEIVLSDCDAIDIAVEGEGEYTVLEIIKGLPVDNIEGLYYRDGVSTKFNGERDFLSDLDKIPFPTYKGFNLSKYGKSMQLSSSRGCPYQCTFCGAPKILGKKWRKRSVSGMLEEFDFWYAKGYKHFYFNDSNFAVDKNRIEKFCDSIIKRNCIVTFSSDGLRADHVNRQLLEKMYRASFTTLTFGVESGSDKVLKNIKKGESVAVIEKAIKDATEVGFEVSLFFLIGSPGETVDDVEKSFELALRYPIASAHFFNLTPIPGTEFYEWCVEKGYFDETQGRYPENNFGFSVTPRIETDSMTKEEIANCLKKSRVVNKKIQEKYLTKSMHEPTMQIFIESHVLWSWERVTANNRVALFGAGFHTEWLLRLIAEKELPLPNLILDENCQKNKICNVKIIHPDKLKEGSIDTIVLSTDTISEVLTDRSNHFYGNQYQVIDLYKGFPLGPYPKRNIELEIND